MKLDKTLNRLFKDKKKRYLYLFLFCLPFLIGMAIFGFVAFKEAKNLIGNISSSTTVVEEKYEIKNGAYVIRKNATDLQKEKFNELKDMLDGDGSTYDANRYAQLVAESYVCDFYTWTNKKSQYDVGGMYYVFADLKNNLYINARDEFYKYVSTYIEQYGAENLLEVETITSSVSKNSEQYIYTAADGTEHSFDSYDVKCNWTYKDNSLFSPSRFEHSKTFTVVNNNGRFEIVEGK